LAKAAEQAGDNEMAGEMYMKLKDMPGAKLMD
jgi:hypothetical protein